MSPVRALCLAVVLLAACTGRPDLSGRYVSVVGQIPEVQLELMKDGKGEWTTETDSFPVQWEVRGGEVWLHTKSGGVIKGSPRGGALLFSLPGTPALVLERTGPSSVH